MSQAADTPTIPELIRDVVERQDLGEQRAYSVALGIMEGDLTPSQIAGLLVALRMKGETVDEIVGFARAMREKVLPMRESGLDVVDTCGTGGDASGTFNISTICSFVAAGAGVPIAKHGNRSVSSLCGSAELLDALGVQSDMEPEEADASLSSTGMAFLFAPRYHQATRHAAVPRKEIGTRSIFNLVGPLTNPARARRQLMGVFRRDLTEPLAQVLGRLGSDHCMVVHGEDGLDEISLGGSTRVSELRDGSVTSYNVHPEQFGLEPCNLDALRGGDPQRNAAIAMDILSGVEGPPRDIVLLNSGAAIYVAGRADTIEQGIDQARASIDTGAAIAKLALQRKRAGA